MAPNQSAVTPPLAKCLLPLLTLFTSTDDRLKLLYHRQKAKCLLPLLTFFTSTDGNTIPDDIWQQLSLPHHRQEAKSLLPLLTLYTSTDGSIIGDDIRH